MKYQKIAMSLLFLTSASYLESFFNPSNFATQYGEKTTSEKCCGNGPKHMRVTGRHIEGKGIGYNQGYSTLEGFVAPDQETWPVLPFLDVRGHVFDNGKWAANAGLGVRARAGCRVYGGSVYYDYRHSKKRYSQIGVGFETLGTVWDFRINGYIPVGNQVSRPYKTRFSHFAGHSMILSRKYEFSMPGLDAEGGVHWGFCNFDFFAGAGPYYFHGRFGPSAYGGKARIYGWWKEYVGLQVSYSYDNVFKSIVQGEVSLSVPLGPRPKVRTRRNQCCDWACDNAAKIDARLVQPVYRDEIIVVNHRRKHSTAINPATGNPYVFWFVNNLSHSAGTFESPFNTLANAEAAAHQNEVIYVYNGDGTSTGMNLGIILQSGQQLLGATTAHSLATTVGTVTVPAQASGTLPLIINGNGPVVTLADNNVVSGFYIQNRTGQGILGTGINNFTATQNFIQGVNDIYNNIEIDNSAGVITISNNTIMMGNRCITLQQFSASAPAGTRYIVTNNRIDNNGGTSNCVDFDFTAPTNTSVVVANNIMTGAPNAALSIASTMTGTNCSFAIINNQIDSSAQAVLFSIANLAANITITDNVLVGAMGIDMLPVNCNLDLSIINNNITAASNGMSLSCTDSPLTGTINNNTINMTNNNSALQLTQIGNIASFVDLTVSNNRITGGSVGVFYLRSTVQNTPSSISFINNSFNTQSISGMQVVEGGFNNTSFAIDGNRFNGFVANAVSMSQAGTGKVCLEFIANTSALFPNAYLLQQTSGVFNLEPPSKNVGQLIETGTITPVSSCN
jgi:hypothetical protein